MRGTKGGMGVYRGRRSAHDVLKTVAIVLAVLVVLVLAGLFFGQRYIVYGDDGIRLELPFFQTEEPEQPVKPDEVEIREEDLEQPEEKPEPAQPAEPPVEEKEYLTAVELPLEKVLDGTALDALKTAGANALVVEMKDREGRLNFVSAEPVADRSQVSSTVADINQKLKKFNENDVYTVARLVCFADNQVPYHQNSVALRASYGNWRDLSQKRWLDPTGEKAQNYIIGLCSELAALGFDEILLEQAACPVEGNLEAIQFADPDTAGALSGPGGFLDRLHQSLAQSGTKLSVSVPLAAVEHTAPDGGLTAKGLDAYADRVWVAGEKTAAVQAMQAAGFTRAEEQLVVLQSELQEKVEFAQAFLG